MAMPSKEMLADLYRLSRFSTGGFAATCLCRCVRQAPLQTGIPIGMSVAETPEPQRYRAWLCSAQRAYLASERSSLPEDSKTSCHRDQSVRTVRDWNDGRACPTL